MGKKHKLEVTAKRDFKEYYYLNHPNHQIFISGTKGDNLDRALHVHDGDKFKIIIEKVRG